MWIWGTGWPRVCAAALCAIGAAWAGAAAEPPAADVPAPIAALGLDAAQTRVWSEGLALEADESFDASNQRYEELAASHPESAFLAWRIARNHWRQGEHLPPTDKEERRAAFTRSLEWADRSLARDPNCGECVLWAVLARGRLATTGGVLGSVPVLRPMAALIDRGLALQPASRDNEWNTTLGNLYLAASAFYRVTPEAHWVDLLIGAHGDKDRALDYIQRAIAISPMRVDYRLEHGVVLMCIGFERNDTATLERGKKELARVRTMPHHLGTDAVDQENAEALIARPDLACGYSRDGFIDLRAVKRAGVL